MVSKEKIKTGRTGPEKNKWYRDCRIEIRVSQEEYQTIVNQTVKSGYKAIAFYVREKALSSNLSESKAGLEQSKHINNYARACSNLNQIARHLNQKNPLTEEVQTDIHEIKVLLDFIKSKLEEGS